MIGIIGVGNYEVWDMTGVPNGNTRFLPVRKAIVEAA
jgi:hypothetical protein